MSQKSLQRLNEEIFSLKTKNAEMENRMKLLEVDFKRDAEAVNEKKTKGHKCDKCEYSCKSLNTFRKHVNTKHPTVLEINEEDQSKKSDQKDSDSSEVKDHSDSEDKFENDIGLYEIEMIDGGILCVCNFCDEGFEVEDNIEKHMKDIHNKVMSPNKWTSCLDRGCGMCNECSLDKYD